MKASRRTLIGTSLLALLPVMGLLTSSLSPGSLGTAPPADTPARASDIKLVVTALDEKGEPVVDLASSDFQIFDDGNLRQIQSIEPGGNARSMTATPPPVTLILYDLLNSDYHVREASAIYISDALQPLKAADGIYLYILTNHDTLFPIRTLPTRKKGATTSSPAISADKVKPPDPPWTKQIRPLLDQAFDKVVRFRTESDRDYGHQALVTLQALNQLGWTLAGIPGPKTFVWITAGVENWPNYPYGCKDVFYSDDSGKFLGGKCTKKCDANVACVDYTPFFQHFSAKLNQANTVFYAAENIPVGTVPLNSRGTPEDTLQQLTHLTGGRMYANTTIALAITDSLQTSRARYQLTYTPPPADDKFHLLRITCIRKGVRIESQRGYFNGRM